MSNIIILIVTLSLLPSALHLSPTRDCILQAVTKSFELSPEHLAALQTFENEARLDTPNQVTTDSLSSILYEEDSATFAELQRFIMTQISDPTMIDILTECGVSDVGPKRRCEEFYGRDSCVRLADFVWGRACDAGFEAFGLSFCVPKCPIGLKEIENDPFFCERETEIQRAGDFDIKEKKTKVVNGLEILRCPEGFVTLGSDFCQKECPMGWNDFGGFCQKPLVKRRKFEIFVYDLSLDDFLIRN